MIDPIPYRSARAERFSLMSRTAPCRGPGPSMKARLAPCLSLSLPRQLISDQLTPSIVARARLHGRGAGRMN